MIPTILFLMLWNLASLQGLATWYGPPQFHNGDIMTNGEGLDLAAATVAVDVSHRDWLNEAAIILTECGGVYFVTITDLGYLEKAKPDANGYREPRLFRRGVSKVTRQLRYWPVVEGAIPVLTDTIEWESDVVHKVVADFPRDFFLHRVACDGDDTTEVRIYVGR